MPNTLEHERERFQTMSVRQLRTRLGKITDRQKLQNFIQMCREFGYEYNGLRFEAERKLSPTRSSGEDLVRVTSTNPSETFVPIELFCQTCELNYWFCSERCRGSFIKNYELEEKRKGIRVIKIKRR